MDTNGREWVEVTAHTLFLLLEMLLEECQPNGKRNDFCFILLRKLVHHLLALLKQVSKECKICGICNDT